MERGATRYDVAIIGSGIAGSTLGAILARHGVKTIIFEAGSHPKFAVGESMILETSETLRAMAELYDVPELAYFSSENYWDLIGTSHGVKRHFSFLHHSAGEPHDLRKTLQAVIPRQPHGHELHLYRQDSDYYLAAIAVSYGVTLLQNTRIKEVNIRADGVEIVSDAGQSYAAEYVVDAGGYRSPLADQFGLRDHNLRTHARALFTHMIDVPCYNDVGASRQAYSIPYRLSEGTLHHVFRGGWLWVIPFNNHPRATNPLCSVGLQLDPRLYPLRADVSPAEEFFTFVDQYPSMRAQFQNAKAVRGWTRTGRMQYSSTRIVGDRYCLLGHAAGFIDPLYSKGLYTSFMSVSVLADLLLEAQHTRDYGAERFKRLEAMTLSYVRTNDRLVANSYKSWGDHRLWSVYAIVWLLGAYLELVKLMSSRVHATGRRDYYQRIEGLHLAGGGFAAFDALADAIDTLVEQVDIEDETMVERAVTEIRALLDSVPWMPRAYQELLKGKNHLPRNKLRPGLLLPGTGFMGSGAYQEHFFGHHSPAELVRMFLREKVRYSAPSLAIQRRLRLAGRPPGLAPRSSNARA